MYICSYSIFLVYVVFLKCRRAGCHMDTGVTCFHVLSQYPVEPPECVVDFPVPFSLSWTPQVNNKVDFK